MLLKSFYAAISVVCLQLVDCFEPKIVGGRPAYEEEFPFVVALRKSYNDEYFCSGSILTRKYALTAAHCMYYDWGGLLPPIIVSVTFGQTGLNVNDYTFFRNVSKIILHPDFDQETKSNDIAILEIRRHFPVTNILISHLKLPSHRNVGLNECQISGWGFHSQNEDEELSKDLFVADVKIVEFEECARMFKEEADVKLTEGMVCAGHENGNTDSCRGDSGGPLVCDGVLVGIISAGIGCGNPLFPGIYTDIHHYMPWIESCTENSVGCKNNNSIMCFLILFVLNMFQVLNKRI